MAGVRWAACRISKRSTVMQWAACTQSEKVMVPMQWAPIQKVSAQMQVQATGMLL